MGPTRRSDDETPREPNDASREPASPEEERALEKEELESFRRRREWMEEVMGPDVVEDDPRPDNRDELE